ncbi:MAG: hypothetical protein HS126_17430 [Anaerolineales bacterium]|nr:hypothetical protein [Anaerolineales bacterium]
MVTKELIKAEVDRVEEKNLEVLYKIVKALSSPLTGEEISSPKDNDVDWHDFIEETYGCLADAPIERGDQGQFEVREAVR